MYRRDRRGLFLLLRTDYDSIHGGTGELFFTSSRGFTIGRFFNFPRLGEGMQIVTGKLLCAP